MSSLCRPHKLLVANRGEIAVRILRTAARLQIPTVAIYTRSDATSPHVLLADEAVALRADDEDPVSNSRGYLDAEAIVRICRDCDVTLVHPGYGFLSENPSFASLLAEAGLTFLGPRPETIRSMGLKHESRTLALGSKVPLVPGLQGLLANVDEAISVASEIGFPVMLKSTAGGGGMGLVVCRSAEELRLKFPATQERAKSLFHNDGVFLERYYPAARHVEVQVFGNGLGHVIHMGERECSVQRRHQKVIEETPSPFMVQHPDIRGKMCAAAVRLCEEIKYGSAGTVEFLVDDSTGNFFFLEMNTRLQVEHPVTEAVNPGLDIVELMIRQGIAERESPLGGLAPDELDQGVFHAPAQERQIHAIEARVYCENPFEQFKPCSGILQHVSFAKEDWLRVDTWVETGTAVTPFFDPLVCKLVVTAPTRSEAIARLEHAISKSEMHGPASNMAFLRAICQSDIFRAGNSTTTFLDTFSFTPRAMTVKNGGLETTVQDFPGRRVGLGIPRSGPMDSLAFRVANILVGNAPGTEALEITLTGCELVFHVSAVIAVTGAAAPVTMNGDKVTMWQSVLMDAGGRLRVGAVKGGGFRVYLAIKGGFPEIPTYLSSKSTSMGLGGHQGRSLSIGDHIALGNCDLMEGDRLIGIPPSLIPTYTNDWIVYCLPGPHCDEEFVTAPGIEAFFSTKWHTSASSNRMGIRLEGPQMSWARTSGGEGGSHPSNIHDNGYALGTINVNGDTPVILTNEGPDMGGYVCICTIASADLWKVGQMRPGCTVQFKRIPFDGAMRLEAQLQEYFQAVAGVFEPSFADILAHKLTSWAWLHLEDTPAGPKLYVSSQLHNNARPKLVCRQAGDGAILVEYGEPQLDLAVRARVHALETGMRKRNVPGIWSLAPCIRSVMVHFDYTVISQSEVLSIILKMDQCLPDAVEDMRFPGRRIIFPIVLDDRWNREALERYMQSTRDKAVYLPSNIEYLARNNDINGGASEALRLLISTDWLVFGVGFYLACPFLVPVDPRCRLVGQKMNPSRTYTPRGALGIAGLVAAIYPVESPGGYQLFGRTLPPWQTWGKGPSFTTDQPWLLQPFDQIKFEPASEEAYSEILLQFDAGRYKFRASSVIRDKTNPLMNAMQVEETVFSMSEYKAFETRVSQEVAEFKTKQARAVQAEEAREQSLLQDWYAGKAVSADHNQTSGTSDPAADDVSANLPSPLSGSIWKICCQRGTVIRSAEDVLVILEAMKTEIKVEAGDENVGRTVAGFAKGIREGATVNAGDILVLLA
ncbi:urea carboxylase [Obba rivulosa]|uniref:Urea carboxylase n=1 Tax=Obba rivulosa TaxID=1052685 RepID=A0A8E2AHC1_9APHY|nr:urea carboxylase [Obba rivulosa]